MTETPLLPAGEFPDRERSVIPERIDAGNVVFTPAALGDSKAAPLIDGLASEYVFRHGGVYSEAHARFRSDHAEEFTGRGGLLLLGSFEGQVVLGGAFKPYRRDDEVPTAEFKRIWTAPEYRRRGLARLLLAELEREAALRGYERVYLTTGAKRPEALALYPNVGYTPLFDTTLPLEQAGPLAFEKSLDTVSRSGAGHRQ